MGTTLASAHVPGTVAHLVTGSVAAADLTGARIGGAHGSELVTAAHSAFVISMSVGIRVAAAVALVSAIGAVFAFRPRRPRPDAAAVSLSEATVPVSLAEH